MVISSRTVISFLVGLGLIGVLIVIGIGNYIYDRIWPCPPQMVRWVDESSTPGGEILGLLVLALIIGAFIAAVRSLVIDNRSIKIGSGAKPLIPKPEAPKPADE
jgi:hypothetical protein